MSKLKIVYKPIAQLIPYARNSRTHNNAQVAQIASSIKEFGWTNPILLDGENGIIAGHGRVMAGRLLGETQVPTIELSHLTENQKKAYIIADNKLALNAEWDNELLKLELEALSNVEQALTGFTQDEISLIANGWNSDIEIPEEAFDEVIGTLKIKIENDQMQQAKETIANALTGAGIEYDF